MGAGAGAVVAQAARADAPTSSSDRRESSSMENPVEVGAKAKGRASSTQRPRAAPIPLLARAANDRHIQDPQFFDHRAYRPRQVDAGRPADPAHRRADRARDEPAIARQYGHR